MDEDLHPCHKCGKWLFFFFSTGKAGGGSHEFQGMLSSSWDERGWEGEGASTGKVKSGRMRKDGNAAVVKAMPRVSRDGL